MSCPGGCIGGGGGPIPTTPDIRKRRIEALYKLDKDCVMRASYENEDVLDMIKWAKGQGEKAAHSIFHTKYKKRK